jgi:predicted DNA-binding protein YlxM (UPF0122 family)
MDTITPRQSLIFCLRYRDDWSVSRIARFLAVDRSTVWRNLKYVKDRIADLAEELDATSCTLFIGQVFDLWAESEPRQQPQSTALREEQLASDLEARMARRANELSDLSECMGADCSPSQKRSKGHAWTAWELAYLRRTGNAAIPTTAYRCGNAGRDAGCPCSKVVRRHEIRK